jgi:hypothetical protein
MFGTEFGEKCIIVQFLGMEKDGKAVERRGAEYAERTRRKI